MANAKSTIAKIMHINSAMLQSSSQNSKAVESLFAQFMPKILLKEISVVTKNSLIIANQIKMSQNAWFHLIKQSKEGSNVTATSICLFIYSVRF